MCTADRLPNELWLAILRLAVHVPSLLDPAFNDESVSPWFKHHDTDASMVTRKTIVQVCRTWWELGIELLYEYIDISTLDALERLVECFEESVASKSTPDRPLQCPTQEGYGWWTKRLNIRAHIPPDYEVTPLIVRLFERCFNVRVLDFAPAMHDRAIGEMQFQHLLTLASSQFGHSLRRFTLDYSIERIAFNGEISYRAILPDLPLDTVDIQYNISSTNSSDSITKEQIRALDTISTLGISLGASIASFPAWRCPSLRHLKFMYIVEHDIPPLTPFLELNGDKITSLTLFIGGSYQFIALRELLPFFPNLRSFGYNPLNISFGDSILSTTIKMLRLSLISLHGHGLGTTPETTPDDKEFRTGIMESFPNVNTIRIEDGPMNSLVTRASTWIEFITWCHEQKLQVHDADGYLIPHLSCESYHFHPTTFPVLRYRLAWDSENDRLGLSNGQPQTFNVR